MVAYYLQTSLTNSNYLVDNLMEITLLLAEAQLNTLAHTNQPLIQEVISQGPSSVDYKSLSLKPLFFYLIQ